MMRAGLDTGMALCFTADLLSRPPRSSERFDSHWLRQGLVALTPLVAGSSQPPHHSAILPPLIDNRKDQQMTAILSYIVKRIEEPTSIAAISGFIAATVGLGFGKIDYETYSAAVSGCVALFVLRQTPKA